MSNAVQKSLFFITSESTQTPVIEFLKKRDFLTASENQLSKALNKIIETQPDYLFISIDHADPKITTLISIFEQYTSSTIVAYIENENKDSIKKIDSLHIPYKISTTLTGPAVERVIQKHQKDQQLATISKHLQPKKLSIDEVSYIKTKALALFEQDPKKIKLNLQKEQIKRKNELLSKTKLENFNDTKKTELANSFRDKLQTQLIQTLSQLTSTQEIKNENTSLSEAYCLLVQSEHWCGYLIFYSDLDVQFTAILPILIQWLQSVFTNLYPINNSDHFKVSLQKETFQDWAHNRADFVTEFELNSKKNYLYLIAIKPNEMMMNIDEENHLIQFRLEQIPTETDLNLTLYLHLPENKKYIIYTPLNQKLSIDQKKRLIDRNIDKLFTPFDFEQEFKKIVVENQVNQLIQKNIRSENPKK